MLESKRAGEELQEVGRKKSSQADRPGRVPNLKKRLKTKENRCFDPDRGNSPAY